VLIIKTTLATEVEVIAKVYATKLKDKKKPPIKAGKPESLIILKVLLLYVENKKIINAIKKNEDLKKRISQTPISWNCLIISPPQLRQKPPNSKSIYPGTLYKKFIYQAC